MGGVVSNVAAACKPLVEPTRFVGRVRELEQLERRVSRERLVTIVAGPGLGKTRLAMRFALSHASASADGGVWFVDLRAAADLESACVRIAQALGIAGQSTFTGQGATVCIGRALNAKGRALVVLDNAEHLLPGLRNAIVRWLDSAPHLHLLVTSRSPIEAFGEDVLELDPLDGGGEGDGVRLFIDRVRAQQSEYRPDDEERARIARFVGRLGGNPLAVELYAATAGQDAGSPDSAKSERRVTSIRDPVAWGFARLPAALREVLVQCSVFRGSFGHGAANAIIALPAELASEVPSLLLGHLIDQCLVQEEPSTGRMWLCEGVRSHAQSCLDELPDASATRWRHALHYAALGDQCVADARNPGGQARARAALATERDEIEAALDLAAEQQRSELVLRLCSALDLLSSGSGLTSHQLAILDGALLRAPSNAAQVGRALGVRAAALRGLGRLKEASNDARVALTLAREAGDRRQVAAMLVAIGTAAYQLGDFEVAAARTGEALALAKLLGDYELEGASLQQLAGISQSTGDMKAAESYYAEAIDLAMDRDDEAGEMRAAAGLGSFHLECGDHASAMDSYNRALLLGQRLGAHRQARIVLGYIGTVHFDQLQLADADRFLERAALSARAVGDARNEGFFEGIRGGVLAAMDRLDCAATSLDLAARLLEPSPFFGKVVEIHRGHLDVALARANRARGDEATAQVSLDTARSRLARARSPGPSGELPIVRRSDDARIAARILERAIEQSKSCGASGTL